MPRLFLSYRVADATDAVDHLDHRLRQAFGADHVFRDKRSLEPGDAWPDRLRSEVQKCDALLAVIGPAWLKAADSAGRRRLDQPGDWVRSEILQRLQLGKLLIPVTVGGADMPPQGDLPDVLQPMSALQSAKLRPGGDYESDFALLVAKLRGAPRGEAASLPPPPVLCTGRDDLIRKLLDEVLQKGGGIPLAGPGGIGKSTIALEVLHHPEVIVRFEGRRHFARLDAASSAAATERAVAVAVGVPLDDPRPIRDRLLEFLRKQKQRLLVLDNAETPLLAEAASVRVLMAQLAATGVTLIATLRPEVALGPGWRAPIPVTRVSDPAAMVIFREYSASKFDGDTGLAAFIRLFEGHPLAVRLLAEQAAFYPRLRDLEDAWRRKRTALLTEGTASGDAGFEATLELSVTSPAMSGRARRLLGLLGKLPDGIHYDDIPAILGDEGADAAADLRRAGGIAFDDPPRLRVLAPVRQFLQDRHSAPQGDWLIAARHYAELGAIEGRRLGYEGGAEAVRRLLPELGNLDLAVREMAASDLDQGVRAVVGLAKFSRFTGLDFQPLLTEVLGFARRSTPGNQAACIEGLGGIALARSDHETARARYGEALPLYENAADMLGQANCIQRLGDIALERSDHDTARERYAEALPLYERVGDVLGQANCIYRLGGVALERSDHDTARARCAEALPLYEKVGDVLGQANCIQILGDIALERSDHDTARARYAEALPLYERVGAVVGQANCIQGQGDIAAKSGDPDDARTHYQTALDLYTRIGEPYSIGWANVRLARIAADTDSRRRHVRAAREAWTQAKRDDLLQRLRTEFPDDE